LTAAAATGGFAAEVGRGQQVSIADAAAGRAGRVNFGPTVRRPSILILLLFVSILMLCLLLRARIKKNGTVNLPYPDQALSYRLSILLAQCKSLNYGVFICEKSGLNDRLLQ